MLFLSSINSLRSSSRLRSTDEYPSKDSRIRTFVKLELAFALPEDNGLINRLSSITVPLTGKQNPGRSTSNFPNEPDLLFPLGGDQSADRAAQPTSRNTCWPNVKRSRNHYRLEPNDSNILFSLPLSLSFPLFNELLRALLVLLLRVSDRVFRKGGGGNGKECEFDSRARFRERNDPSGRATKIHGCVRHAAWKPDVKRSRGARLCGH